MAKITQHTVTVLLLRVCPWENQNQAGGDKFKSPILLKLGTNVRFGEKMIMVKDLG